MMLATVMQTVCLSLLMIVGASAVIRWRPDHKCGSYYRLTLPNGTRINGECNPDEGNPCCSSANWCGDTWMHCGCGSCIDYRLIHPVKHNERWRSDQRCGGEHTVRIPEGGRATAECNPDEGNPCCSADHRCGNTEAHCHCPECVDYSRYASTTSAPESAGCWFPYVAVGEKCLLYSKETLTWSAAEEFCKDMGGDMITFHSLDDLMQVVDNFTMMEISEESSPDLEAPYWVGLRMLGRQEQEEQIGWRWLTGDFEQDSGSGSGMEDERCHYLLPMSSSVIAHDGDCTALKLPLCQQK